MTGPLIRIEKTIPGTPTPSYAHFGDAAMDLSFMLVDESFDRNRGYEVDDQGSLVMEAGAKVRVLTGLRMKIETGYCGVAIPRSGLGSKQEVVLANTAGLIDSGYLGDVMLTLRTSEQITIKRGDAIAQIAFLPVPAARIEIVESVADVAATVDEAIAEGQKQRGTGGFGSSGQER